MEKTIGRQKELLTRHLIIRKTKMSKKLSDRNNIFTKFYKKNRTNLIIKGVDLYQIKFHGSGVLNFTLISYL